MDDKCKTCMQTKIVKKHIVSFIEKLLHKFYHFDSLPVSTPRDPNMKLTYNKGKAVSQKEYARIIGRLMYAMHCTRPDITYVIHKLS